MTQAKEELTRHVDSQSQEHQEHRQAAELAERLVRPVMESPATYARRVYTALQAQFGVHPSQFAYRAKHARHGTESRMQAALLILESGTFNLPAIWRPGMSMQIDSESSEGMKQAHTVYTQYLKGGQVINMVNCTCVDHAKAAPAMICKHLCAYLLLAESFREQAAAQAERETTEQLKKDLGFI